MGDGVQAVFKIIIKTKREKSKPEVFSHSHQPPHIQALQLLIQQGVLFSHVMSVYLG